MGIQPSPAMATWDLKRIVLAVVAIVGFVGPVVLAVTYTLLVGWVRGGDLQPAGRT
jgi:hypothetical protein